jgi:Cof subfamily protein (haloacid dehalogenase superfamily)
MSAPTVAPDLTLLSRGTRPELVAIDVDHTLIREDRTLSLTTIEAVAAARAAGIEIVLASSRPPRGMQAFLGELSLLAPVRFVSCQGGHVASYDERGVLETHLRVPMAKDAALAGVERARAAGASICWYAGEAWIVEAVDPRIEREARNARFEPTIGRFEDQEPPEKLLLISSDLNETLALAESLRGVLDAEISNPRYLEVTAPRVGKESGVAWLAETLGVAASAVVAMGDGRNDLGLFAWAGLSVAPANAHPDVLRAADVVTHRNDDDGIAAALDLLRSLPTA